MKGVLLSLIASITFGALYFYSQLFKGLDGQQVFAWRMLATLPFLTLFMYWLKDINLIQQIYIRLKHRPSFILPLLISSFLTCSQLWLFLWGPLNGRGLEVSLGYFSLPITMVAIGAFIYKEKLTLLQWLASASACIGISIGLVNMGGLAWETLYVALGYPLYFLFRRYLKTDHLGGFWWDICLSIPIAIMLIIWFTDWQILAVNYGNIFIFSLVAIGLGLLSTIGLGSYMMASRILPFALFGLLSYLEPILLALASFILGERINTENIAIYTGIWIAMLLLMLDTLKTYLKHRHNKPSPL